MTSDSFVGLPVTSRRAGAFSFAHWKATNRGHDPGEHEHRAAHFMFIVAGDFASSASAARQPALIYNPPRTVHRDHFVTPHGAFFSVAIDDALDVDLPRLPTIVDAPAAHVLMMRLMREASAWCDDSEEVALDLCLDLVQTTVARDAIARAPAWLLNARRMLESAHARISIAELSRAAGVHRGHMARAFRQHFGCSPAELARMKRLRRAAHLLVTTLMPLADVALSTGFADQSHLTHHFRRSFGMTPLRFRALTT